MALSDALLRTVKPNGKTQRLFDAGGLYLEVTPTGSRLWRQKYRYAGKEKRLAHGVYPEVTLREARERRDAARKLLASGVDPGQHKKAAKLAATTSAGNSFEVVAREWFGKHEPTWATNHSTKVIRRLERDVFPWLGARPIAEITAPELLQVLRRIEGRALETAHRALQNCGQVFRYAVATGRAERDPTPDLRGALAPWKPVHFASITDPEQVGELLLAMDGSKARPIVKSALLLAPLVFTRPGELREAKWSEFDLDAAEWHIPAERMKMRQPHLVPLSKQAVAILRELHPLTGHGQFGNHVFPGRTDKTAMSNNAVRLALRKIGYDKDQMSGHGFRAMARTVLDEVLGVRPDFIEHQLAHAVRDPNGRAYNRTAHLAERRKMMQTWADYLDKLKAEARARAENPRGAARRKAA
jgi:integrase